MSPAKRLIHPIASVSYARNLKGDAIAMTNEKIKLLKEGTAKNLTEVVFILDKSGSMRGLEDDTIGGFNSMIDKQKEAGNDVLVSTVLFNQMMKVVHDRVPIAEVKSMTREDYVTEGCTALLDAIGSAIEHIKTIQKYARDGDRPDKTMFIITTDGMENSSTRYSFKAVKELVEKQKERNWEFLFLGANIDAIETAAQFGIDRSRAANYHSDHVGTHKAFDALGGAMLCFMSPDMFGNGSLFDSGDWKKDIEEDFKSRKSDR